jgi:hypothetical protein
MPVSTVSTQGINLEVEGHRAVSLRWEQAKGVLRRCGRHYRGLRVIDLKGAAEVFPKGHKHVRTVLANIDRQPASAFRVFVNLNDEVAVQEIRPLSFYHLV